MVDEYERNVNDVRRMLGEALVNRDWHRAQLQVSHDRASALADLQLAGAVVRWLEGELAHLEAS